MNQTKVVIHTSQYEHLMSRRAMTAKRTPFLDGETGYTVPQVNYADHTIVVGGFNDNDSFMELYDTAAGVVAAGANRLTVFVPYFGYSTMERQSNVHEVVTAKNRANILSAIPQARHGNDFIFMDTHTEGLPHYMTATRSRQFKLGTEWTYWLQQHNRMAHRNEEFVIASCDVGRLKQVEWLAGCCGTRSATIHKDRLSGSKTEVRLVLGDVAGCHVYIVDDMIRSGGSMLNAAAAYLAKGARSVSVFATHAVMTPGSVKNLCAVDSPISHVTVTDSHPNYVHLRGQDKASILPLQSIIYKELMSL